MGVKEKLLARAIDLRKAYKQLPLDEASLPQACVCVFIARALASLRSSWGVSCFSDHALLLLVFAVRRGLYTT